MNKLLKVILISLCIAIIATADPEDNNKSDVQQNVIEFANVHLFADGTKFAKAVIQLKIMIDSIKTLSALGSDLDKYEVPHRGVVLSDVIVINKVIADQVFQKAGNSTIIPYRYLRSELDCSSDPFLGYSCTSFFKVGSKAEDFGVTLAFTFGKCQVDMNSAQMRNVETTMELLTTNHKEMLADKLKSVDDSAKEYAYYNSLYEDAVSKRDFTNQIPLLEAQLIAKKAECKGIEGAYNDASSNYNNELAQFNSNKEKISSLTNEITSLTAKKSALETEQVEKYNANVDYDTRKNRSDGYRNDILASIQIIISTIDPNFFNGMNCINGTEIRQECINLLNYVR